MTKASIMMSCTKRKLVEDDVVEEARDVKIDCNC